MSSSQTNSQTNNIYSDFVITITNNLMSLFFNEKYVGYMQSTNLEKMKETTYQILTLYFITIRTQQMQSVAINTFCENILNVWFYKDYLNQSIHTKKCDELLYNVLYSKITQYLTKCINKLN